MVNLLLLVGISFLGSITCDQVTIGITHWGDVRSHLDPMQKDDLPKPCVRSGCVGGIPQLLGYINNTEKVYLKDVKKTYRFVTGNLVSGETGYLSVPDFGMLTGPAAYGKNGWETFGKFLDGIYYWDTTAQPQRNSNSTTYYTPDYMSLGIKEFESGLEPLGTYLDAFKIQPVVSNMPECDNKHQHSFCKNKTKLFDIISDPQVLGKAKIGVVGFVNPLANILADASNITFKNPADEIAKVIEGNSDLRELKFVIAVGSGNYELAKEIINKNSNVKLVIYGGGTKDLTNNYPAEFGKGSYIATAGMKNGVSTKLGALKLTIDSDTGELVKIDGKLQELDVGGSVLQDQIALEAIIQLKTACSANNPINASAAVKIDGGSCWKNECNLGNLMTDAMVHCAHFHNDTSDIQQIISVWHGGAFFPDQVDAFKSIRVLDIHTWLPYHNKAYLVKISGATLRRMFEKSATALNDNPAYGQFLQVSNGIEVTYHKNSLYQLRTTHYDNGIPKMQEIEDNLNYYVVIPSIIARGKSVYDFVPDNLLEFDGKKYLDLGYDDACLQRYLEVTRKVTIGFEERIYLEAQETVSECNKKTGLTVFLTLFITALLIGGGYATWRFFIQPRRENGNFCC